MIAKNDFSYAFDGVHSVDFVKGQEVNLPPERLKLVIDNLEEPKKRTVTRKKAVK